MSETYYPIINAGDVGRYIGQPEVVLVDARGGLDADQRFQTGHLRGAVFMDLENDLSRKSPDAAKGGRHPLPDPGSFGSLLGKAGITPSTHVLVYDDKGGANAAARFWWMMKAAGHRKIQVVDGGFAALLEGGLPIAEGSATPLAPQPPYPVQAWNLPTADLETVERVRSDKEYLVIDVRESYRYAGQSEPIDLVAGHIPGAVNIPYLNNLQANGKFQTPEALADQYHSVIENRSPEKVIVHCGSGVTACHTLLAMDVAGIRGPGLYVGSWSEWSRNEKPLATGQKP